MRPFTSAVYQDRRAILVGGAQNPARTIMNVEYNYVDLNGQVDREQAQLDAEREPEHAHQLLKDFDGTGM